MNRLVVPDLHLPFVYPSFMRFCKDQRAEYGTEQTIFIGDIVDNYMVSTFVRDPVRASAGAEFKQALAAVQKWHDEFPNAIVIVGNHDIRPFKRAREGGIPGPMMKELADMWQTPTWTWLPEYVVDRVKYVHGDGMSGPTAALRRAITSRMSVVMGHTHSFGGVQYHANDDSLIFGMNVGWGGDEKAYAFEYGRANVNRGTVGCGLVVSRKEAHFLPADLNGNYRRRKHRR